MDYNVLNNRMSELYMEEMLEEIQVRINWMRQRQERERYAALMSLIIAVATGVAIFSVGAVMSRYVVCF